MFSTESTDLPEESSKSSLMYVFISSSLTINLNYSKTPAGNKFYPF